ncbi:type III secretion system outer membrane ring subunit SctC [Yersinia kristensenii]|uniref:type III secretion system outer membrane ring subunit SctC n=1 Tax=Yersinia kristensenii TaxID=28152 RepID=UPI0005E1E11A|nr:type III secretion system outer membrane ring subunit SctC [Yersinia kristensenii]CNF34655.1 type III secretion system protein [Yersinia kristensenii]
MMRIFCLKKIKLSIVALLFVLMPTPAFTEVVNESGYIARQESVNGIFDAISSVMKKPVILSKLAARKKITGEFDLSHPQNALVTVSQELGLIWYSDGQAIYFYDASEMRNAVIMLRNISFNTLESFLKNSGLFDPRFPLSSDNHNAIFYVSGPPIYVDLITSTARYLDQKTETFNGQESIAVIAVQNTFVEDRAYNFRQERMVIPGMANVINRIIGSGQLIPTTIKASLRGKEAESGLDTSDLPQDVLESYMEIDGRTPPEQNSVNVIADPGSNSLLVRGSPEQVEYIRSLAKTLDFPKRHIELSVWIVDLSKEAFDNLGVQWTGNLNVGGSNLGISLNGGSSTIDGASFMVTALALSEKNQANIISRPMILTQENTPAIFDNSRTFYASLVGDRVAQLDNVTFGTSVSVLPRFTQNGEIEMMLNVEDGNQFDNTRGGDLPDVGRTNISTIARVPKGKSLLIGGYTHDEKSSVAGKIPLLGDIPLLGSLFRYTRDRESSMVRVFLIQPREIEGPLSPDAHTLIADMKKGLDSDQLQNWMNNYLDSQKWR